LALVAVLTIAAAATACGSSGPSETARKPAATCHADPAAAIKATPDGGTWTGAGCYVTTGIVVSHPVTINGGTFDDTAPGVVGQSLKPIIKVLDTSGVTIENVTLNGSAPANVGLHGKWVGQAGIDVRSSSDVTLTNDATNNTYGDGLTLFYQSRQGPDSNIVVDGYTVTNAGRVGITPADVTSGSFDNIDVVSAATSGIDLEADVKGLGDGTLTFDHVVTAEGIHIVEPITSATFTDTTMSGDFLLTHPGAVSYQGSITCNRRSPVACVTVKAGTLALDATFAYLPGTNTPTTPFMRAIPPGVITTPTAP
jgi:hypothetical protein